MEEIYSRKFVEASVNALWYARKHVAYVVSHIESLREVVRCNAPWYATSVTFFGVGIQFGHVESGCVEHPLIMKKKENKKKKKKAVKKTELERMRKERRKEKDQAKGKQQR
ncbi:hypothetical protein HZH66_008430 [Vespula vulgaris]|uniref:Uncharacterized protein n=1 Tax=Vespula vulgaris TaxID=7454 RepID=A0A834N156_VESVU|nr:hypothetical protein HZH66_008430 [Vespula vulgaris]